MGNSALKLYSGEINNDAVVKFLLSAPAPKEITQFNGELPDFMPITSENMHIVWDFVKNSNIRTTDFSYGGLLMWVEYFKYSYAIVNDTLFIKGVVEDDVTKPAFALPIGKMDLSESLGVLKKYCEVNNIPLELSAVPESALSELSPFRPVRVDELIDWGDYLYDAYVLSTLTGKKMSKKRNHVNKFRKLYPNYSLEPLTRDNAQDALEFMSVYEAEGDSTPMAIVERKLSCKVINEIKNGNENLIGAILYVDGEVAAYTIGDVKNDTLFIHVEKALRKFDGAYEFINKEFAAMVLANNPDIKFINREDDSGDEGLRKAKQSYHPLTILKKFNVTF